ncbi:hypothetical protein HQN90_00670 [Paenibacillus alba]|uniref:hypothetical protein n=1 Tax=Paenibacillus alba TaxID=1197127 RepID=UPI0015676586|nr:hypothetical protein [Paenibacillus alba]NQX64628.1 hypothetical protein [Paenibacillus alba]
MNDFYNNAVKRINNIDPSIYSKVTMKNWKSFRSKGEYRSDAVLIGEHFRRVGELLQYISKNSTHFIISLAELITNDVMEFNSEKFEELFPNIKECECYLISRICLCYVHWSILLDSDEPISKKYPDMYEPLIKLIERGGGQMSLHHGEIDGGFGGFPRLIYADRGNLKATNISDQALNQIIKEVEHAEECLVKYKNDGRSEYTCIRCGKKLHIHPNVTDWGYQWYKIICETEDCYNDNLS